MRYVHADMSGECAYSLLIKSADIVNEKWRAIQKVESKKA